VHQALISGVLVQWLIDPERAPTPADLAQALPAIAAQVTPTKSSATKSTATEPAATEPA
jgi:hypothetical protein